MATINPVGVDAKVPNCKAVSWSLLADGDVGAGVALSDYPDKCVQAVGTVVAGVMQGSNDSTDGLNGTWATINMEAGAASNFATDPIHTLLDNPLWVRPSMADLTGTVVVTLVAHRNIRG
jgi:hypothetical protein